MHCAAFAADVCPHLVICIVRPPGSFLAVSPRFGRLRTAADATPRWEACRRCVKLLPPLALPLWPARGTAGDRRTGSCKEQSVWKRVTRVASPRKSRSHGTVSSPVGCRLTEPRSSRLTRPPLRLSVGCSSCPPPAPFSPPCAGLPARFWQLLFSSCCLGGFFGGFFPPPPAACSASLPALR